MGRDHSLVCRAVRKELREPLLLEHHPSPFLFGNFASLDQLLLIRFVVAILAAPVVVVILVIFVLVLLETRVGVVPSQGLASVLLPERGDVDAEVAQDGIVVDFVRVLPERAQRAELVATAEQAKVPREVSVRSAV